MVLEMTGKKLTDPVTLKRHFSVTESQTVHLVHSTPLGLRESSLQIKLRLLVLPKASQCGLSK